VALCLSVNWKIKDAKWYSIDRISLPGMSGEARSPLISLLTTAME
jgi:hypothetical protein